MKPIIRLFILFFVIICINGSCKEAPAKTSENVVTASDVQRYEETKFKASSDYEAAVPTLNIKVRETDFLIRFVEDRSYLRSYFRQKMVADWQSVIYNFTYDASFNTAEKQIKVLTKDDEGYLLLPGYTEEMETFTVYYFSPRTFEHKQTIALPEVLNGPYTITAEKAADLKFYATTKDGKRIAFIPQEPTLIDRSVMEQDLRKLRELKTESSSADKNVDAVRVVQQLSADLNADGTADQLLVLKKNAGSTDFEDQHFNLEFKVHLSQKGQPAKVFSNAKMAYMQTDACVSEGYSNIVAKQNYFTIEGQTCYDRSIIVNNYITFKVTNNEVLLHRYSEEYFDKADHDREIPSRSWTEKDFGKIRMTDVSEDFLIKLRQKP